jgi:rod shape-determining protein MreC
VQGLSDPNSKVSVLCNRSRVNGVLEAWPGGKLLVRFPVDADVKLADTLVTSGMGGVFPKGLSVGIIRDPHTDAREGDDILKAWEVKPFQNPDLVEEVFVLIRKDSWTVGAEK